MALIELAQVARTFGTGDGATTALTDATFSIARGEFVSIMGASGSGKSTLLHILGLLDRPFGGTYRFAGRDVRRMSDASRAHLRNARMGFIFQSFHLLARVSVLENVMLPLYYSALPAAEWRQRAASALERVDLSHRSAHLPSQLSGGERQRAAIARALILDPDVIFADEPTGNLDTVSGQTVMNLIDDLHHRGHTIVLVTHEQSAAYFGERLLTIRDGAVTGDERIVARTHTFTK